MKIGITLDDSAGLDSNVSAHFGQCGYFLIADIENNKIKEHKVVENNAAHGGGGCVAVSAILQYGISYVIAGGMGMGAQQKFIDAGVQVFGYEGNVQKALDDFIENKLDGLGECKDSHHQH